MDDVIAKSRQLQEDLVEMERQSIDKGQRYYRERQYWVNAAAVARRILLRVHAASHTGSVASCEACGADLVVVRGGIQNHGTGQLTVHLQNGSRASGHSLDTARKATRRRLIPNS